MIMRYLYVIGAQKGPVEIGVAAVPRLRLRELQIGNPFKLEVLAQCGGGEQEKAIAHEFFRYEQLSGEWFKRSKRMRQFIDMMNCGVGLSLIIRRLDPKRKSKAGRMLLENARRDAQERTALEHLRQMRRAPAFDVNCLVQELEDALSSALIVVISSAPRSRPFMNAPSANVGLFDVC
jgi:hypothetical protein